MLKSTKDFIDIKYIIGVNPCPQFGPKPDLWTEHLEAALFDIISIIL